MAGDITAMTNALCELRQEGKVSFNIFKITKFSVTSLMFYLLKKILNCVYIKCL